MDKEYSFATKATATIILTSISAMWLMDGEPISPGSRNPLGYVGEAGRPFLADQRCARAEFGIWDSTAAGTITAHCIKQIR